MEALDALKVLQITAAAVSSVAGPAAALYYGKDAKRSLQTFFLLAGVTTIAWGLFVYSMIYSVSAPGNVIGNADAMTINNGDVRLQYQRVCFEAMYMLLAAALVAASVQHRIKPLWLVFIVLLYVIFSYAPLAHWLWALVPGSGWLGMDGYGAFDYAGGLVIHLSAGVAALVLGATAGVKPVAAGPKPVYPVLLLILACLFLNSAHLLGSALGLLNTQLAAFSGVCSYAFLQILFSTEGKVGTGSPTLEGAAKGAIVGLAAVANYACSVAPMWTVLITFIAVLFVYVLSYVARNVQSAGLEVFLVHGVSAIIGSGAGVGLFSQSSLALPNTAPTGAFFGNSAQLGQQCAAISVCILLSGVVSYIAFALTQKVAEVVYQTSILLDEPAAAPAADVPEKASA